MPSPIVALYLPPAVKLQIASLKGPEVDDAVHRDLSVPRCALVAFFRFPRARYFQRPVMGEKAFERKNQRVEVISENRTVDRGIVTVIFWGGPRGITGTGKK